VRRGSLTGPPPATSSPNGIRPPQPSPPLRSNAFEERGDAICIPSLLRRQFASLVAFSVGGDSERAQ
jgi:hypothetical protein